MLTDTYLIYLIYFWFFQYIQSVIAKANFMKQYVV